MRKPEITCQHCNGGGKVPLSDAMSKAYEAVCMIGEASTEQVLAYITENYGDEIGLTAICNRMTFLSKLDLVTSHQRGRNLIWRAAK
jgi:hypothetical protein